ncbi:chromate transporter [Clostridium sp. MCC353]|uniref:chromate transporter n=1 Tax=Clostridium sp. MCC353 TaxID=2592646 RepID=UPI001C014E00|nr:chromate transporter [Clostridium sp. MCC353]MBT9780115.1 chromate transporter [Clostridium sp. MCC353]
MGFAIKRAAELFGQFFKLGCFTFGGGWSIVAQMQKRYVEEEGRLTSEDLLDMTSVGRSLPGTMIGNVAFLFGYHEAGVLGGIACVIGMIMPPMLVLTAITYFYSLVMEQAWVMSAMVGVRAAVVPIIGNAVLGLRKGAFRYPACYVLAIAGFCLYLFAGISCVALVVIGVGTGILICEIYERKGAAKDGIA